jgi:alkylation response protein AidB-like acyl-CoA dehydrogenase
MSTELAPTPPLFHEEHEAFRESAATWLLREVVPHYNEWRRAGRIPRALLRAAGEHGYLGMRVPEEHGGIGVEDPRFGIVVAEEAMAVGATDLALVLTMHNDLALPALLRAGLTEALPGLATGDLLATVATGDVKVDGSMVDGTARFIVSGLEADLVVVAARDGSLALVERGAAGLSIHPGEAPIGLRAAGLADLTFERTPALVLGSGEELSIDRSLTLAVTALAGARAALVATVAYVAERKAFGRPIAAFQNTRHALATVRTELWAADAFFESALRARMAGRLDAARAAALQLHCCELYERAVDAGVQLHGGYGYVLEYAIAHAFADARFWSLQSDREELLDAIADHQPTGQT